MLVVLPVPPCATVTAALSVSTVADALGRVNVFVVVVGPVTAKNPFPVPPFAPGKMPVTPVLSGSPVALVSTIADGVPNAGVVKVGEVPKTNEPDPVSFEITPASCAEVVDANCESGLVVKASPVPPVPLLAAVIRPSASTVIEARV